MSLGAELTTEISKILRERWSTRKGNVVPESADVKLGNDAVTLNGTVLYADLRESTDMVDRYEPWFSAEVYKAYLHCAAKIITSNGGTITAYDGDRIMAVYIGDAKNTSAVRSALKLNYAVDHIINPTIQKQYTQTSFQLTHVVAVDTSDLFVARTGIRGSNDLVWVGAAANHAAKMTALAGFSSWITEDVFNNMNEVAVFGSNGAQMWTRRLWTAMNNRVVYGSNWLWSFD